MHGTWCAVVSGTGELAYSSRYYRDVIGYVWNDGRRIGREAYHIYWRAAQ